MCWQQRASRLSSIHRWACGRAIIPNGCCRWAGHRPTTFRRWRRSSPPLTGSRSRPYTRGFGAMAGGAGGDPADQPHIGVGLMRPRSRGRLRVTSDDPAVPPIIEHRYDSDPHDVAMLSAGAELARELASPATDSRPCHLVDVAAPVRDRADGCRRRFRGGGRRAVQGARGRGTMGHRRLGPARRHRPGSARHDRHAGPPRRRVRRDLTDARSAGG